MAWRNVLTKQSTGRGHVMTSETEEEDQMWHMSPASRRIVVYVFLPAALAFAATGVANAQTGVVVNGFELTRRQAAVLAVRYGPAPPGRYWYDSRSGAWGIEGYGTAGFLQPGFNLGPLKPDASRGNTGVFINGRELNSADVFALQRLVGVVYRGRWWLDGRTGYFGAEGSSQPLGNILSAIRAQRDAAGRGDRFWSSRLGAGNWSGGCGYVNAGGTFVGTGSCR